MTTTVFNKKVNIQLPEKEVVGKWISGGIFSIYCPSPFLNEIMHA
jgi:hypothetical protein